MLFKLPIKIINNIHIFVIGIVFLLLGIYKKDSPKILYYTVGILALLIPILMRTPKVKISYWNVIKITHYFFVMPLLLYIAYKQDSLSNNMYDLLIVMSITIIIYHSYKLYTRMK